MILNGFSVLFLVIIAISSAFVSSSFLGGSVIGTLVGAIIPTMIAFFIAEVYAGFRMKRAPSAIQKVTHVNNGLQSISAVAIFAAVIVFTSYFS